MTWRVQDTGSWKLAVTDSATDLAGALALPGSWPVGQQLECFVRNDQVANLPAGPPVAGYLAWYDASAISGVADGASLATWPDGSSNHYDVSQGTGANQPVYWKTNAGKLINGKPVVEFNGTSQWLTRASGPVRAQPFTMVAVAIAPSTTQHSDLWCSNGGNIKVYHGFNGPWSVFAGAGGQQSPDSAGTTLHFVGVVINGASSAIQTDGSYRTISSPGNGGLTGNWSVGWDGSSASEQYQGRVCELMVYPSALSTTDLNTLRAYCQGKWGTP